MAGWAAGDPKIFPQGPGCLPSVVCLKTYFGSSCMSLQFSVKSKPYVQYYADLMTRSRGTGVALEIAPCPYLCLFDADSTAALVLDVACGAELWTQQCSIVARQGSLCSKGGCVHSLLCKAAVGYEAR